MDEKGILLSLIGEDDVDELPDWIHDELSPAQVDRTSPPFRWRLLINRAPFPITVKAVAHIIESHCHNSDYSFVLGAKQLADEAGCHRDTIYRATLCLEGAGFVVVDRLWDESKRRRLKSRYYLAWPADRPVERGTRTERVPAEDDQVPAEDDHPYPQESTTPTRTERPGVPAQTDGMCSRGVPGGPSAPHQDAHLVDEREVEDQARKLIQLFEQVDDKQMAVDAWTRARYEDGWDTDRIDAAKAEAIRLEEETLRAS